MAKLYLKLILARRKTFADVPSQYQAAVKKLIAEAAANGDILAQELLSGGICDD